jgi:hypothetical protein
MSNALQPAAVGPAAADLRPAAAADATAQREPVLAMVDRVCELCFGLFMALPFLLLPTSPALLVSRVLTLAMLFGCGLALGRHAGGVGVTSGFAMIVVGVALTAIMIVLGG